MNEIQRLKDQIKKILKDNQEVRDASMALIKGTDDLIAHSRQKDIDVTSRTNEEV